eukprot:scaffold15.g4362.t1
MLRWEEGLSERAAALAAAEPAGPSPAEDRLAWSNLPTADLLCILAVLFAPPEGLPFCDLVPLARQYASVARVCRWWRRHAELSPLRVSTDNPTQTQVEWLARHTLADVHFRVTRKSALDSLLPQLAAPPAAHVAACLSQCECMTAEVNEKTVGFESPFAWPFHPLAGHGEANFERMGVMWDESMAEGDGARSLLQLIKRWPNRPTPYRLLLLPPAQQEAMTRSALANSIHCTMAASGAVAEVLERPEFAARNAGCLRELSLSPYSRLERLSAVYSRPPGHPFPAGLRILRLLGNGSDPRLHFPSDITSHMTRLESLELLGFRTADLREVPLSARSLLVSLGSLGAEALHPAQAVSWPGFIGATWSLDINWVIRLAFRVLLTFPSASPDGPPVLTGLTGPPVEFCFRGATCEDFLQQLTTSPCEELAVECDVRNDALGFKASDISDAAGDVHALETDEVFRAVAMWEALASPQAVGAWHLTDGRNETTWLFRLVRKGPLEDPPLADAPQ